LDPSVIGWADIGGIPRDLDARRVRQPNIGQQSVAQGVLRFFGPASKTTLVRRDVNGEPGILAIRDGAVRAVLVLTIKDGLITRVYAQADPRKLAHVSRVLEAQT
jgi:RNA polymerase sigma-70 factor (ECF subfamily)